MKVQIELNESTVRAISYLKCPRLIEVLKADEGAVDVIEVEYVRAIDSPAVYQVNSMESAHRR